jgi:hypothetical protein
MHTVYEKYEIIVVSCMKRVRGNSIFILIKILDRGDGAVSCVQASSIDAETIECGVKGRGNIGVVSVKKKKKKKRSVWRRKGETKTVI